MLSLVNLTHLYHIGPEALNGLPALQFLYINNNRELYDISAHALRWETTIADVTVSHWPALLEFELIGNSLNTIHPGLLSMHGWHQLQRLRMHNNPWTCVCNRTWFQSELMPAIGPMLPNIDMPCDRMSSDISLIDLTVQEVGEYVMRGHCAGRFDLRMLLLVSILLALFGLAVSFAIRLCGRAKLTNVRERDGRGSYKKV